MTLRDYWRVVWLRRRLIVAIVLIFTVLAFGRAFVQPRVFQATAAMMYDAPADVANTTSGSSADISRLNLDVQSVVNTVGSPEVRARASTLLDAADAEVSYSVSAAVAVPASASSQATVADVVNITAQANSPEAAAAIANAYAKAIIVLRKESQQQSWLAAEEVIQRQLDLYKTPESKLTSDYAQLSQQLRNLQIAGALANGDFRIIIPASPPASPVSPKPVKSAVFGFIVGLFLGVVGAFVVGQFDTRVRSYREASAILDLPVIGHVPRISRRALDQGGLVAASDPAGSVSEGLRVLRRNLDWSGIDGGFKTIVLTSFVKAEGKTLTLCNLAVTLARAGHKVILVDGDLRDPSVHKVFNLPNVVGLTSALLGKTPLPDALVEFKGEAHPASLVRVTAQGAQPPLSSNWDGRLLILTSGPLPPNPGEVMASASVSRALAELAESDADYVLIDTPPLLGFGDAGALASSADGILVTIRIDKARRPALEAGREALDALPGRKLGLVIVGEHVSETQFASYSKYAAT